MGPTIGCLPHPHHPSRTPTDPLALPSAGWPPSCSPHPRRSRPPPHPRSHPPPAAHACPSAHVSYASCAPAVHPMCVLAPQPPGHLMDASTHLTASPPSTSLPHLTAHHRPHHLAASRPPADMPAHLQACSTPAHLLRTPPTSCTPACLNHPSFRPPIRHIHQPLPLPTCPATQLTHPALSPTCQLMGWMDQSLSRVLHTPASAHLPVDASSTPSMHSAPRDASGTSGHSPTRPMRPPRCSTC